MSTPDCIFCKIANNEAPSHKIWENAEYIAFLSIFPNTYGVTVVIPKQHVGSYIFDAPDAIRQGLLEATKTVAKRLDERLEDVGRTALVFEGFGVDHLHAKLFPMHGTKSETWQQRSSNVTTFFDTYAGYISSHDANRASDDDLAKLAELLR